MAQKSVKHQDGNTHFAKWAHLRDNQHCTLRVNHHESHRWENADYELHRVDENGVQDGPALVFPSGEQYWCLNGDLHRLDGPALTWADGVEEWYLDECEMTKEEWARDPRVIAYHSQTQEGAEQWLKRM